MAAPRSLARCTEAAGAALLLACAGSGPPLAAPAMQAPDPAAAPVVPAAPERYGPSAASALPPSIETRLDSPLPGPAATGLGEDAPEGNAEGYWFWERSSTEAGGDERREREEWHLAQEGGRVSGHYDRWVRQVSNDGHPYRCSGELEFRTGARYRVTGEVQGNLIVIYERGYEILEGGPCAPRRRHLDAYQGRISGDEIRLHFGAGIQVLRRGRPDVPTQRF